MFLFVCKIKINFILVMILDNNIYSWRSRQFGHWIWSTSKAQIFLAPILTLLYIFNFSLWSQPLVKLHFSHPENAAPKIHTLLLSETLAGEPKLRHPASPSVFDHTAERFRFGSAQGNRYGCRNQRNRHSAGEGSTSDFSGRFRSKWRQQ